MFIVAKSILIISLENHTKRWPPNDPIRVHMELVQSVLRAGKGVQAGHNLARKLYEN